MIDAVRLCLYSVEEKDMPPTMSGLRERKKRRTRRAIFDAAFRLFAERGYDGVTMAEIAQAADVAPATVFTHYSSKEDLFYGLRNELNSAQADSMRARADESALSVVKDWQLWMVDELLAPEALEHSRTFSRLLLETPALWTRSSGFASERQDLLATLFGERLPGTDVFVVDLAAAQISAAVQTSSRYLQRDLASGMSAAKTRARSRARTEIAFEQLARALDGVL